MKLRTGIAVMTLAVGGAAASAQVTSTFGAGAEGWLVVDYPYNHVVNPGTHAATWDGTFGLPPGALRIGDEYAETGASAPAAFLGDKSAYYGGTLKYDIYIRYTDGATYPAVVLNAGTFSLYYNTSSPPVGAWQSRSIPLSETGWRYNGWQGAAATQGQMQAALAHLTGVYLYTEWHTGADDTHVDNVTLCAVACAPVGCSAADVATEGNPDPLAGPDGFVTGVDFDVYIQAYFQELRRPISNALIADITDGTGTGGPDGFVTGTDFDRFVQLYFLGC